MNVLPAIAGVAFDQLAGEPPAQWHPVAGYGTLMSRVEQHVYADRRIAGAVFATIGVGVGITTGLMLRAVVGSGVATAVATAACSAGKMLDREADSISGLLRASDLPSARRRLRSLVGRTTDSLDETGISRAVVESVAENSVDAVTASLFWAAVGGAPGVLAHRAVNTLDAMVGHHNDRYENFGWASAHLDDLANYLPARMTAISCALARPHRAKAIWRVVQRDAPRHPSPNGGVIEAAFAAALCVRLGGVNHYAGSFEDRGTLGDGPSPTSASISEAIRLRRHATATVAALLAITASAIHFGRRVGGQ